MLEIKVEIEAKGLCRVISEFTAILSGATLELMKRFPVIDQAEQRKADKPAQTASESTDIMHRLSEATAADAQPAATTQVPVATATPAYTPADIAKAGAYLSDIGKREEVVALLPKYGVKAITQLKPEQLGAFAAELRKLGAKI